MQIPLAFQESHFSVQNVVALFHRLGGWIFVHCLVNYIPHVVNGIKIRRVRWSDILGYKVWRILLTPCMSELPLKCVRVLHPERKS